jgi:hypothetical protein
LDEALQTADTINLLLHIEELEGIKMKAMWEDWKFGRHYHDKINKLAVLGDRRSSKWLARLSEPLYARDAQHFALADIDQAWEWLRE